MLNSHVAVTRIGIVLSFKCMVPKVLQKLMRLGLIDRLFGRVTFSSSWTLQASAPTFSALHVSRLQTPAYPSVCRLYSSLPLHCVSRNPPPHHPALDLSPYCTPYKLQCEPRGVAKCPCFWQLSSFCRLCCQICDLQGGERDDGKERMKNERE